MGKKSLTLGEPQEVLMHRLSPAPLDMIASVQGGLPAPPLQPRPLLQGWKFLSDKIFLSKAQ